MGAGQNTDMKAALQNVSKKKNLKMSWIKSGQTKMFLPLRKVNHGKR